ncbi:MAG: hypothetical protein KDA94_11685, partial [Acidimicrobiales bacterium]|nr:hypothetical protein [Acidimicrobiales bacterium]
MAGTTGSADRRPGRGHHGRVLTTIVDHPLARRALTVLRDQDTGRAAFRVAMDDLAGMLVYEATRHLRVDEVTVQTPLA